MEDLKFLDTAIIGKRYDKIEDLLQRNQVRLIIDLNHTTYQGNFREYDIKNNLEQVCLGIQNLQYEQPGQFTMDDMLLQKELNKLHPARQYRSAEEHLIY